MRFVAFWRASGAALVLLLCAGALPALASGITEITVRQSELEADGIILGATNGSSIAMTGELLLPVTSVFDAAVFHDTSRLVFSDPGAEGSTQMVIEQLTFDWKTHTAYGWLAGEKAGGRVGAASVVDVFNLFMRQDGSFELAWTTEAADFARSIFGNRGGFREGRLFGIAELGADPHVPEPATLALLAGGALGLALYGRRRR